MRINHNMNTPYIYAECGYEYMALHRKVIVYDPKNTDNPIIQDYFDTYNRNNNTLPIYHSVIRSEFDRMCAVEPPELPISFKMVMQEINMSWINLIHQMIFIDHAYDTFYGEYKDVIENILLYDSPTMKESLVYRYHRSGISVFHVAAKIWIFNKFYNNMNNGYKIKENTSKILKNVLECYTELENRINSEHCIAYMTDFSGVTLMDYLLTFVENFNKNRLL